jgi:Tfp pilus assembly protein PilF
LAGGNGKKGEMSDAFASFFGDDDDFTWLDEEEEAAARAGQAASAAERSAAAAEAAEPEAAEPEAAEPAAAEPEAAEPAAAEPEAAEPAAAEPEAAAVVAAAVEPAAVEPEALREPVAPPTPPAPAAAPSAAVSLASDPTPEPSADAEPEPGLQVDPAIAFFDGEGFDDDDLPDRRAAVTFDDSEAALAAPPVAPAVASPVASSDVPAAAAAPAFAAGVASGRSMPPAPPPPPPDASAGPTFRLDALLPRAGAHRSVAQATVFDLSELDEDELDVRPVAPAPAAGPADPPAAVATAPGSGSEPLVPPTHTSVPPTHTSVPPTHASVGWDAPVGSVEAPPSAASATLVSWVPPLAVPTEGDAAWAEVARGLVAEAELAEGSQRAELWLAAARVFLLRLRDLPAAARALGAASEAGGGHDLPALALRLAEQEGDPVRLGAALDARAAALEGAQADDVWRRAASLAVERDGAGAGAERLKRALSADATSVASWWALRDVAVKAGDDNERVQALSSLSDLVDPVAAADALRERGLVLAGLDRDAEALESLVDARALDPVSGGPFRTLEGWYLAHHDHGGLAALYAEEAGRWAGAEAGWWWLLAARSARAAGHSEATLDAYAFAVAAGNSVAVREQQAWLQQTAQFDALAAAIEAEATGAPPEASGAHWLRLALVEELCRRDLHRAAAAYRHAAEAGVGLAIGAVGRVLAALGDRDAERAFLVERAASGGEGAELATLRLAELEEAGDPRSEAALEGFAAASRHPELTGRALEGHARVALRTGRYAEAAASLRALADREEDPGRASDLRARALAALGLAGGASAGVAELASSMQAGTACLALDLAIDRLDEAADYPVVATLHLRAAEVLSGPSAAARWVEVARLRSGVLNDRAGATAALEQALLLDPGRSDASERLAQLTGGPSVERRVEDAARAASGGPDAGWHALNAAVMAGLAGLPAPTLDVAGGVVPGLNAVRWERALRDGSADLAGAFSEAGLSDERLLAWVLVVAGGDPEAARSALDGAAAPAGLPIAAARVAERVGNLAAAARFAAAGEGSAAALEAARLADRAGRPVEEVERLAASALLDVQTSASAAQVLVRAAERAADSAGVASAHARLAALAESGPMAAAHALVAAYHASAVGDAQLAMSSFAVAHARRPRSFDAHAGLAFAYEAAGDLDALRALFEAAGQAGEVDAVDAMVRAGAAPVEAWADLADANPYAGMAYEVALASAERWQALFERLSTRLPSTRSEEERARIEARRRWVLAEKLSETDAAWDLYQQLHTEHPDDHDVLENLARIAGARGDGATAIQHLSHLADGAIEPVDAARYRRRIAEVYLRDGQAAEARQAFLDALDHWPDDVEALAGLKQLAERADDWQAMRSVLEREAVITRGEPQARALRQIAEITERYGTDPALVIDAWRRLIAAAPDDLGARRSLIEAAERSGDHEAFLQAAAELEVRLAGAERAAVLRRMGRASEALTRRDDAVQYYEAAVAVDEPDAEAAVSLEQLYREANDWAGVVRALKAQAAVLGSPDAQASKLAEAAQIELELRHDRDAAGRIFEEVLIADAEHHGALRFLINFYYEAGRYEDALPLCERIEPVISADDIDDFDERMEQSSFFFRFAEMLRLSRRESDAIARYERALELNPTHLPTLEAVGPLRVAARQWDRAGEAFEQILQLTGGRGEPQQVAQTYTMLGVVEYNRGNLDKAYKRFNKALESFQNHVPALRGLAKIMEDRKDWNGLLTVYNNVIYHATVQQDFIDAYLTKGRVLDEQMQRQDKAIQHYERSLSFYAEQPGVLLRLAEIYSRNGAWDEVVSYTVRGLAVAEGAPLLAADLHILLAAARAGTGDTQGAEEALTAALALNPEVGSASVDDLGELIDAVRARLPR